MPVLPHLWLRKRCVGGKVLADACARAEHNWDQAPRCRLDTRPRASCASDTLNPHRSGARHLARTSDVQLHIGESRDDGCEIPFLLRRPAMTEAIVRVGTLARPGPIGRTRHGLVLVVFVGPPALSIFRRAFRQRHPKVCGNDSFRLRRKPSLARRIMTGRPRNSQRSDRNEPCG